MLRSVTATHSLEAGFQDYERFVDVVQAAGGLSGCWRDLQLPRERRVVHNGAPAIDAGATTAGDGVLPPGPLSFRALRSARGGGGGNGGGQLSFRGRGARSARSMAGVGGAAAGGCAPGDAASLASPPISELSYEEMESARVGAAAPAGGQVTVGGRPLAVKRLAMLNVVDADLVEGEFNVRQPIVCFVVHVRQTDDQACCTVQTWYACHHQAATIDSGAWYTTKN